MQKPLPPGLSRAILCLLSTLVFFTSCTKEYNPGDYLSNYHVYLTGNSVPTLWSLRSVETNNVTDTTYKGTLKQYFSDGTLSDNLGYKGYWVMVSRDSLIESVHSCLVDNAPYYSNHYHIDHIGPQRLELSYTIASQKIRLIYASDK